MFEEAGGLDCLELLEYHANDELRVKTNQILDVYFYKEDLEVCEWNIPEFFIILETSIIQNYSLFEIQTICAPANSPSPSGIRRDRYTFGGSG